MVREGFSSSAPFIIEENHSQLTACSAAAAGAQVTHVDASKGMVSWAKENAVSSGLAKAPVRWLIDDCVKFVEREIRRGRDGM